MSTLIVHSRRYRAAYRTSPYVEAHAQLREQLRQVQGFSGTSTPTTHVNAVNSVSNPHALPVDEVLSALRSHRLSGSEAADRLKAWAS